MNEGDKVPEKQSSEKARMKNWEKIDTFLKQNE